ncbi:MAG: fibronectin type III domain-containing protein, partial [Candidatus Daviesbacteria bacterium]|nr:fibronectin type III domain-containing protein [Candidatus Daviesbacteria bacterium]
MLKIKDFKINIFLTVLGGVLLIQFGVLIPSAFAVDVDPPIISGITVSNITANSATITWSTDEPADSSVEYGTTSAFVLGAQLNTQTTSMVTGHSQTLSGLTENTIYSYRVKSRDVAGNLAVSEYFTFTTYNSGTSGVTPLIISTVTSSSITTIGATITWATKKLATFGLRSQNSDTQVEYGATTSYGLSTTLNTEMVSSHSQTLSGLTANTLYHYRVKSRDAEGNLAVSQDFTFTTIALTETAPPPIIPPPTVKKTLPPDPTAQQQVQPQIQPQQPLAQPLFISLRGPFYISQRAEEVKNLQTMLFQDKTIYPEGIISGYYGYLTVKAV